jgi:hypothetical protein
MAHSGRQHAAWAPALIGANVLSRWHTDIIGLRLCSGFETRPAIEKRANGMEEWEW